MQKSLSIYRRFEHRPWGKWGFLTLCDLNIVKGREGLVLVVLTEIKENRGMSVTNCCEDLATAVYREYLDGVAPEDIFWIEHYEEGALSGGGVGHTFDRVDLTWDGKKFTRPMWKRLTENRMPGIIGRDALHPDSPLRRVP